MKIEYRLYEISYDEEWGTTDKTLVASYIDVEEAMEDRDMYNLQAEKSGQDEELSFEVVVEWVDENS